MGCMCDAHRGRQRPTYGSSGKGLRAHSVCQECRMLHEDGVQSVR